MPTLRYKDANGDWQLLAGPDEVAIQDTEPPEHPDLWVDMLAEGAEGGGGGSGVTDHGALTGLADDDHPQYHTDARGDARYPSIAYVDEIVTVSTADPDPETDIPSRDGLIWYKVAAEETTP